MKIHLDYIGYTIHVKDRSKYQYLKDEEYLKDAPMFVNDEDSDSSTIWVQYPIKPQDVTTLAHEVVHVLQNICIARGMKFEKEVEHMGYLMQHLLNKILGYEWK